MQERPTTVAAYAAGASLAAVALFYVFGPNYTIDGDESNDSNRKKSIVGLSNLANDCFINSVLQALAGLGDLRVYLIRELHRRELDGPGVYHAVPGPNELSRGQRPDKERELQQGLITRALKEMLDRLNERPIYKKTISAREFIQALELAFRTRISRNQQDAQEFLQIVLERLCDEYHAGVRARQRAIALDSASASSAEMGAVPESHSEVEVRIDDGSENGLPAIIDTKFHGIDDEPGFPFEGKLESQIVCQFCHYEYKPNQTAFVNLTLQVPQKSSTTLNNCFDGLLKTEYIEDFRCDRCRLMHAVEIKKTERARARSKSEQERLDQEITRIGKAISTDPESELEGIVLPPSDLVPKRRIARHMRIVSFPKVIAIHLSRSIFDRSSSTKNAAKVSFPERLPLGGILNQIWYKLLAIVCHKGSHHSGHYESFRRNHLYAPFSTPEAFSSYAQSRVNSQPRPRHGWEQQHLHRDLDHLALGRLANFSTHAFPIASLFPEQPFPFPLLDPPTYRFRQQQLDFRQGSIQYLVWPARFPNHSPLVHRDGGVSSRLRRRRKPNDRWWRISDEKIKECKTSDVLGMQKEVYLLFYEIERPDSSPRGG
ncbi:uncharacterized protein N7477_000132 [Penicillium maclennaniae]|uniref:uncharacterized protein n=1 Tax=Penicillium maclennaniae TaxID=1343394 RepID=UPI002540447F|nr:uncharacterized protein N7477_000132 [Penicillium maclennaniae]KAJ5683787.1 hypothetical protein N7477_000132 [Penicillium maclennaniae]